MEVKTSIGSVNIDINPSWDEVLMPFFSGEVFDSICKYLKTENASGHVVYPKESLRYTAFALTPINRVKCVILGQDPYHQNGQANGLAFAVNAGTIAPPSLRNIHKEVNQAFGRNESTEGSFIELKNWVHQGVLLLNTSLSVRENEPLSHSKIGWDSLTRLAISEISNRNDAVVFILWGKSAQALEPLINTTKHLVIKGVHPSPLSAYRGFFGSNPFGKANDFLLEKGLKAIDWI